MGRIYTGKFPATATTVIRDLFQVVAAADIPVEVHGWHLFQTTDLGDAEEETLTLEMFEGVGATEGSGGNAAAEHPRDVNDATAAAAIETFNDTVAVAGGGSLTSIADLGWMMRLPWDFFFPPELRPRVDPGELWVLRSAAPNDSLSIGGTIWVGEI